LLEQNFAARILLRIGEKILEFSISGVICTVSVPSPQNRTFGWGGMGVVSSGRMPILSASDQSQSTARNIHATGWAKKWGHLDFFI